MNIPEKYKGKYFYHFTHIDNLASIAAHDGLYSINMQTNLNITHHNLAIMEIQQRRSKMEVSAGPGGVVHDYVPFYFATMNKMLLRLINRKVVDQPYIVFMAVPIEKILEKNVVFTDTSANTIIPPHFYDNPNDLEKLDWNLIDFTKWVKIPDTEMHSQMAEVLVYEHVPLSWIDTYIVFDKIGETAIKNCYRNAGLDEPNILNSWFNQRNFFFRKLMIKDEKKKEESLVTGPIQLRIKYQLVVGNIEHKRRFIDTDKCIFSNVEDAISKIDNNFCVIKELADIYTLEPEKHTEVEIPTILVIHNLPELQYYSLLNEREKNIVKLAAYFYDIGKGPKEKWENGIEEKYLDYPADALSMLERIFSEDFEEIEYCDYRDICLLVAYSDLIFDIIDKGRNREELNQLRLSKHELYMLAALSEAIMSIESEVSLTETRFKLDSFLEEITE